jgi:tetratricopeptide (TPR) repeat protein
MTEARIAINEKRWVDAQMKETEAQEQAEKLQQSLERGDRLVDWTRNRLNEIDELQLSRSRARLFWAAIEEADERLAAATAPQMFDEALAELREDVEGKQLALTPDQRSIYSDKQGEILRGKLMYQYNRLIEEAKTEYERQDFRRADNDYQAALRLLETEEAKALPAEQRDKMRQEIAARRAEISGRMEEESYWSALAQAEQSGSRGNIRQAIKAVLENLPDLPAKKKAELRARLKELDLEEALLAMRRAVAEGNDAAARDAAKKVLVLDKDNSEAQGVISNIQTAAERAKLLRQGRAALGAGDYDKAIDLLTQTAKIRNDAEVQNLLSEARGKKFFTAGEALEQAKKYEEAGQMYDKAASAYAPLASKARARKMLMQNAAKFDAYMAQGDQAVRGRPGHQPGGSEGAEPDRPLDAQDAPEARQGSHEQARLCHGGLAGEDGREGHDDTRVKRPGCSDRVFAEQRRLGRRSRHAGAGCPGR